MSNTLSVLSKTPCIVAMELDYAKKAILHCYKDGMSVGDLVTAILDFEETDSTSKCNSEEQKLK